MLSLSSFSDVHLYAVDSAADEFEYISSCFKRELYLGEQLETLVLLTSRAVPVHFTADKVTDGQVPRSDAIAKPCYLYAMCYVIGVILLCVLKATVRPGLV